MANDAKRHRQQGGFSLIELMLAIIVLAIAMGAVAMTLGSTLQHTQRNSSRSVAASLAAEELDAVRLKANADFANLPLGLVSSTKNIDGVVYTVKRNSTWVTAGATVDSCSAPGSSLAYLRISVEVTWPGIGNANPADADTVITPLVGAYDPTKGHVAVKVRNRDADGQPGIRVRLMKGATVVAQQDTTTEGCVFFAYVTPDTYTIEIEKASYVDGQSVAVPTATVSPGEGTVASAAFDFDQRAAMNLTRVDATATGAVIPDSVPLVIANPQLLPDKKKVYTGSGVATFVTDIYPYLAGYEAWAGDCSDADPESVTLIDPANPGAGTTARYPGIDRDPAIPVKPGFATIAPTANVRMAALPLRLVKADGSPEPAHNVRLVHDPDELCTAGATLAYSAPSDASGLITVAAPLGRWRVEIVGHNPKTSWPVVDVTPPFDTARTTVLVEDNE